MTLPIIHAASHIRSQIVTCEADSHLRGEMRLLIEHLADGTKKCSLLGCKYTYEIDMNAKTTYHFASVPEEYRPKARIPGVLIANYATGYAYVEADGKVNVHPIVQVYKGGEVTPVFPAWIVESKVL